MAKSLTEILQGPIEIKLDAVAIGYTDDSTEVEIARGIVRTRPDELPSDAVGHVGPQGIKITGNLLQWSIDILEQLMPELTREGDVLFGGRYPGTEVIQDNLKEIILHPLRMGTSTAHDVKIYKGALLADPLKWGTGAGKNRTLPFEIIGVPDTSQDDGKLLFSIGETADAAAPTRSATYPTDTDTDIAIDVVPYVTFDKGMSRSAMCDSNGNPRGIHLYDITNGAVVPVTVSFAKVTLDDDKVLITPAANLENSAEHALLVDTSAYSKGGGKHAGSETTFTTVAA